MPRYEVLMEATYTVEVEADDATDAIIAARQLSPEGEVDWYPLEVGEVW